MEVLVAVIAFAGALLAAVATGALANRLRGEPTGWLIAWSIVTAMLAVSLGVMAFGLFLGFGATTFRLYQLTGSLLAPLWLAVGVIQLLARKPAARFGSWLPGAGFTAVALVILLVDPVRQEGRFGKGLPVAAEHWNPPPAYLLMVVQAFTAVVLLVGLVIAVLRWRRDGDDYDTDNLHALGVLAPTGLALAGASALGAPGLLLVVLHLLVAAAVWYVVLRPLAPYEDEDEEDFEDDWEERPSRRPIPQDVPVAGRRTTPEQPSGVPAAPSPRRSGLGDLVAEYRAGEQDVDYAARMRGQGPATGDPIGRPAGDPDGRPAADDPFGGPATGMFMAGEYGMPIPGQPAGDHEFTQPPPRTGQFGMTPSTGPSTGEFGLPSAGGPATGEYDIPLNEYGAPGTRSRASRPMPAEEAFGGRRPMSAEEAFGAPAASGRSGAAPGAPAGAGEPVRLSPGIYGLLTVFTLIDGTGEAFDRLAEETVEAVRRSEPDTLIYACHSVKSAPLQRIVYEIYRDEVAYTEHQSQPHMERFVAQRQSMVLAANVIELNVNTAKVIPLPTAFKI
ncbi:antibiotic biosynthesis monooxygenase [Planomonospora alba]